MKTPTTYYGGKQMMVGRILSWIPTHNTYVEPFLEGGAVFWAKKQSNIEVINDLNDFVINFYEVVKNDFEALRKKLVVTLHSRKSYNQAKIIYKNQEKFDKIERAWAFFVMCNFAFGSVLDARMSFCKSGDNKVAKKIAKKIENFTFSYCERLRTTTIENDDALTIIKRYDTPHTFFYLDPPYMHANQGHYAGYSEQDFENLLHVLANLKGKYLLSNSYSNMLERFVKDNNLFVKRIHKKVFTRKLINNEQTSFCKNYTELTVANYDFQNLANNCPGNLYEKQLKILHVYAS